MSRGYGSRPMSPRNRARGERATATPLTVNPPPVISMPPQRTGEGEGGKGVQPPVVSVVSPPGRIANASSTADSNTLLSSEATKIKSAPSFQIQALASPR